MSGTVVPAELLLSPSGKTILSWKKVSVGTLQIFLLGISIVIGGQLFSWNAGLQGGFYTFLFSTLFVGSGYVCLCLCLAEMTSILPFAGGSYGFARVTVGPYLGYLIGCCESIESIIYVPATLLVFGTLLSTLFGTPVSLEPVWWLLFYGTALFLHIGGGMAFWNFISLIGIVSLVLIVLYCLATPAFLDYDKNVSGLDGQLEPEVANVQSPHQFMQNVHLAAWFFVGVEGMPLSCLEAVNAKVTVPRAILMTVAVLFITALGILFCTASLSPGVVDLASAALPLSAGYSRVFSISTHAASLLALPGIYATAFGFMFLYGRQMCSMSKSGLFPKFLSETIGPSQTPYAALIAGSAVGYVLLILFNFTYRRLESLFNICILGSFFVYLHSFASFIIFRRKFSRLHRNFTNPLGIASAVYGMFVFVIAFIGVAAFQNDNQEDLLIFIGLLVLCSLYYYFEARKRQFFSAEEQSIMFVTYIIAGNAQKKLRNRRTHSSSSSSWAMSIKSKFGSSPMGSEAPVSIQSHLSFGLVGNSPEADLSSPDVTETVVGVNTEFSSATGVAQSSNINVLQRSSSFALAPIREGSFSISRRTRIEVIDEEGNEFDTDGQLVEVE